METSLKFLLVLAAVLVIVCCLVWLAGSACLMGKSHKLRGDIEKLFEDLQDIAEVAKKFLGKITGKVEDRLEDVKSRVGDIRDTRLGAESYTPVYPPPVYPPENDERFWRSPTSQYHSPYFE